MTRLDFVLNNHMSNLFIKFTFQSDPIIIFPAKRSMVNSLTQEAEKSVRNSLLK